MAVRRAVRCSSIHSGSQAEPGKGSVRSMIRVGNAQAFWGDRPSAAFELLSQAQDLDFLTMDYLAEVSMSILALQRERDATRGFPQDFVDVVGGLAAYWAAGGALPTHCKRRGAESDWMCESLYGRSGKSRMSRHEDRDRRR